MAAPVNGERLGNAFFNVTDTHARHAVGKAIRLITYCRAWLVVLTTTGICKLYAEVAILRRGGGFFMNLRHP